MTMRPIEHEQEPWLVIEPPKRWQILNLREVVEFRDLLVSFMRRDLKLRYRQTALGVIWVVLQPLISAGVFSFIFGRVAKFPSDGVPYFVFAFVGTMGWSVFSASLTKISGSLVGNAQLVSKIFFPRLVLPLSMLGSVLVDLAVGLGLLAILLVIAGVAPGVALLTLPLWIVLLLAIACGLGLMAASLMVSYRDVGYVLPVIVQVLLYASPVAYSVSALPHEVRGWYQANPMSGALEGIRWALLDTAAPGLRPSHGRRSSASPCSWRVRRCSPRWSGGSPMSSSDLAIRVSGLSKAYTIRHQAEQHITLAEKALSRVRRPLQREQLETFWALKDIDLEVRKGEVLGIIGRNGAGKSTLLKVLSRITAPTKGRVELYGRLGSLLEVGTGFHPELTGRENIYLNGTILGMKRSEIDRRFDEIVDFAGVEQFLDTPVKRYSSGMYVRLAFAVAAHLNTEIVVIDEVLAVGDAQFQERSVGKMRQVGKDGRTVLVVSHNMDIVRRNRFTLPAPYTWRSRDRRKH